MKRGQMTMYAVIGTVITLVAFAAVLPLLSDNIDSVVAEVGANSATAGILNFLIPAMALGIIAGFLYYVSPSRQGGPY